MLKKILKEYKRTLKILKSIERKHHTDNFFKLCFCTGTFPAPCIDIVGIILAYIIKLINFLEYITIQYF